MVEAPPPGCAASESAASPGGEHTENTWAATPHRPPAMRCPTRALSGSLGRAGLGAICRSTCRNALRMAPATARHKHTAEATTNALQRRTPRERMIWAVCLRGKTLGAEKPALHQSMGASPQAPLGDGGRALAAGGQIGSSRGRTCVMKRRSGFRLLPRPHTGRIQATAADQNEHKCQQQQEQQRIGRMLALCAGWSRTKTTECCSN